MSEKSLTAGSIQRLWAFWVCLVFIIIIITLQVIHSSLVMWLIIGFALGYTLQRSRFCFAAGFRDVFLIKNGLLTRALFLLLILTSVGFFLLHWAGVVALPQSGALQPVGYYTVLGGLLFGLGSVFAGSCVSGSLMRAGEGYVAQWVVVLGILIGSAINMEQLSWWNQSIGSFNRIVFLPDYYSWSVMIVFYLAIFSFFTAITIWVEEGSIKSLGQRIGSVFNCPKKEQRHNGPKTFVTGKPWSYLTGAVVLAMLNILLLASTERPASIIGGISNFAWWLLLKIGFGGHNSTLLHDYSESGDVNSLLGNPTLFFAFAIVIGALCASLLNREFKIRLPRFSTSYYFSLSGGILLGFGARIAMGCNIGGLWSGISSFSLHGWLFGIFIFIGSFIGGKLYLRFFI